MSRIHRPGRMPVWQRWSVLFGMFACALSGLLFLLGHELGIGPKFLAGRYMLTMHGVSANLAVFLFGTVVLGHVRVGLNFRLQLFSGISSMALLLVLITSSWLLYYGSEEWRDDTVLIHWGVGIVFAVLLLVHLLPLMRGFQRTQ